MARGAPILEGGTLPVGSELEKAADPLHPALACVSQEVRVFITLEDEFGRDSFASCGPSCSCENGRSRDEGYPGEDEY